MQAGWIVAGLVSIWAVVATSLAVILTIALRDAGDDIEALSNQLEDAYQRIENSVEQRVARWVARFRETASESHAFWTTGEGVL